MARLPRDFDSRMGMRNFAGQAGYSADYRTYDEGQGGGYGAYRGWGAGGSGGSRGGYGADYRYGGDFERGFGGRSGYAEERGSFGDIRERGGRRGLQADADRVRARDIMTEDPEVVTPDTTVADAARKMRELNVGIIPVVESQESRRLKGVVTDRDLAIRVLAEGKDGSAKVSDCITTEVQTVNRNDGVREVFNVMKREQVRRVPVTDRERRLVGIISQADLAVNYAGLDLQRETEVEEVIGRVSEPAEPRRSGRRALGAY